MNERYIIGVDVGGTNIRIGAKNQDTYLRAFVKIKTKSVLYGDNLGDKLADFIERYIEENFQANQIEAIALGFPATVSRDRRTVLQTPNIEGFNNMPVVDILEKRLKGVRVFLERDVNLLFYNDVSVCRVPREGLSIGIYIGTGIGNAIFVEGKPLRGKDGVAGELGHIPMMGKNDLCGCGNRGCSETYAAGWHLVKLIDKYYRGTDISQIFLKYKTEPCILEFIDAIACVVATEVNILNPECVVLGGGVIAMSGFPKRLLEERIYEHVRKPQPGESLDIRYSSDSVENGVRGAVIYADSMMRKSG